MQADRILRHVAQFVGCLDRDLQESQLEQFHRGQTPAAGKLAGLADIAIVEANHTKSTRGEQPAQIIVPLNHLGAEPHDHDHGLGSGVTEDFVTQVDAVGAGDLRRLMG